MVRVSQECFCGKAGGFVGEGIPRGETPSLRKCRWALYMTTWVMVEGSLESLMNCSWRGKSASRAADETCLDVKSVDDSDRSAKAQDDQTSASRT